MTLWLCDELEKALASVPGSNEREHILILLRRAERYKLATGAARAVAETILRASHSVERNLDLVVLKSPVVWLEYELAGMGGVLQSEDKGPGRIGCLIACDPTNEEHLVGFVAWSMPDGRVLHSYAVVHWKRAAFLAAAKDAPNLPRETAAERMLALTKVSIPSGLLEEMKIWHDLGQRKTTGIEAAIDETQRDATSQSLFVLAALLFLNSSAIEFREPKDEDNLPVPDGPPPDVGPPTDSSPLNRHARRRASVQFRGWQRRIGLLAKRVGKQAMTEAPTFIPGNVGPVEPVADDEADEWGEPVAEHAGQDDGSDSDVFASPGRFVIELRRGAYRLPWHKPGFRRGILGRSVVHWTQPKATSFA